jgi:hypothetical protein
MPKAPPPAIVYANTEKTLGHRAEVNAKENIMTRISTLCVLSSTLVMLALSADEASAFTLGETQTKVPLTVVQPKIGQPKVYNNAVRAPKLPAVQEKRPGLQKHY